MLASTLHARRPCCQELARIGWSILALLIIYPLVTSDEQSHPERNRGGDGDGGKGGDDDGGGGDGDGAEGGGYTNGRGGGFRSGGSRGGVGG